VSLFASLPVSVRSAVLVAGRRWSSQGAVSQCDRFVSVLEPSTARPASVHSLPPFHELRALALETVSSRFVIVLLA
jgi:hypothetical protein